MRYKVILAAGAQVALGGLLPPQRRAVHDALDVLARRPTEVGRVHTGSGPEALRQWELKPVEVSIQYRVRDRAVMVEVVWLIASP
ncbi:hypothetical protein [Streptomyces avicenniae]|uniref:hypothetical protein n=1 Tax=Streptomyces avicenniae TaxID=500153 RepID=UPI00069BADCA|nr:hypothetical protein [Streptomyces avicenniae]